MNYKKFIDEDLIEKVYLYSYKKLSNRADAEDLAQDILLEAFSELNKERIFHNFYSWFWQLAHNRYCVFLSKRNKTPYTISIEGGQIVGSLDSGVSVHDSIILQEEMCELNYTISRLSKEHREMVIMYYLKEMKIKEIADSLNIPVGTVKRRLFDTKNNLKKGLENMNKIGKYSYAPAELNIWGGFNAPRHWHNLDNLILHQIFIVCRSEAKTINEIADEIGIAPAYLEKIIEYPLEHKFLKVHSKNKYLTDFCVIPGQTSYDAQYRKSKIYENIGIEITEILENKKDAILSLDFYGNKFDYDYLLWILYVFACSKFSELALLKNEKHWENRVPENNGKDYRIAASFTLPDQKIIINELIKQTSWSNLHEHFENDKYGKITYVNFFQSIPFSNRDGIINASNDTILFKLMESNGNYELNEIENEQAAFLISKGIIVKENGKLKVNIPIMTYKCESQINDLLMDSLRSLVDKYVDEINKMADEIIRPVIREDLLEEYAHWILHGYFFPVRNVFYWAINEGKTLAIPTDYSQSAAGLYLKIR